MLEPAVHAVPAVPAVHDAAVHDAAVHAEPVVQQLQQHRRLEAFLHAGREADAVAEAAAVVADCAGVSAEELTVGVASAQLGQVGVDCAAVQQVQMKAGGMQGGARVFWGVPGGQGVLPFRTPV